MGWAALAPRRIIRLRVLPSLVGMHLLACFSPAKAYDINEKLSITGIVAGAVQYQFLKRDDGGQDEGGGAIAFQPRVDFRPTPRDQLVAKLGFATGNGLNDETPFAVTPWSADLEDDVKDINGSGRNYLLTAWYQRLFRDEQDRMLSATVGLIDATDYLDQNAYINDEFNQFMNQAFDSEIFLPSYDVGAAVQWKTDQWSVHGVVMNVNENDDGNNYSFLSMQVAYAVASRLGQGNYRITLGGTTKEFLNPTGTALESRDGISLSFDQQFGGVFGGFMRLAWQDQDAAVDFGALYSGGVNIAGKAWHRPQDNMGIGYAYVVGGNTGIDRIQVLEVYARLVPKRHFAVTLDLQYMNEALDAGGGPIGWIPGVRLAADF
jgi:hypothetical protein